MKGFTVVSMKNWTNRQTHTPYLCRERFIGSRSATRGAKCASAIQHEPENINQFRQGIDDTEAAVVTGPHARICGKPAGRERGIADARKRRPREDTRAPEHVAGTGVAVADGPPADPAVPGRIYTDGSSPVGMGQHVLVPVDGSSQSEAALEYVLDEMPDPTVTLLHVVGPVGSYAYGDDDYFDVEGYREEQERRHERGERMLDEYRDRAVDRGVEAETVVTTGRPAARILEAVEDRDVDHVVMGSRGRSGVGRVLFGSVAETVTRRASVPVTIVR